MNDERQSNDWKQKAKRQRDTLTTSEAEPGSAMLVWIGDPAPAQFPDEILEEIVATYGLRGVTKIYAAPAVIFSTESCDLTALREGLMRDYKGRVDAIDPGFGVAMAPRGSTSPSL